MRLAQSPIGPEIHRDWDSALPDYVLPSEVRIGVMEGMRGRLDRIEAKIAAAAASVGRERHDVTLIAVSKTVPVGQIQQAYDLGVRHFGESRLQEALPKIEQLPADIIWHYIGTIQTNKARKIVEAFDVVHAFDSSRQVDRVAQSQGVVDGLIAVNLAQEPQKSGVFAEGLDEMCNVLAKCKAVRFRGLMTIGRLVSNPEESRDDFRRLANLGRQVGAEWLSMGMSADYAVAIQEGSTHIRVGSAIFGLRT